MSDRVWNLIDSETMVNGTGWADAQSTVRAVVFGKMIELGRDRIKHYRSDLYHDAMWIASHLTGAMSFDWMARDSGTWIGDIVAEIRDDEFTDMVKYRFEIINVDRKWTLNVYEAGPFVPQSVHYCEECGTMVAKYVDYMSMWLCSDYCTGKAENRLKVNVPDSNPEHYAPGYGSTLHPPLDPYMGETDTCDDEFYPYFSTEPLPEEVVERVMDMEPTVIEPWTIERLFEGPTINLGKEANWVSSHEALPVTECDMAYTASGCIYHPAPPLSPKFRPTTEEQKREMVEFYFPTPSNDSNNDRKVINMYRDSTVDSIRELLEEKLSDLQSKVEELNDARTEIDDAIEIAERNVEAVEEAINSLDLDLEDFSVEVDVSFSN